MQNDLWMRPTGNCKPARDERVFDFDPFSRPFKFGFPRFFFTAGSMGASCSVLNLRTTTDRNVKRFRGGLVFKAHRLLYHSTLGLEVIKKKKKPDKGLRALELELPPNSDWEAAR